jgi:hypothetical protein
MPLLVFDGQICQIFAQDAGIGKYLSSPLVLLELIKVFCKRSQGNVLLAHGLLV